MPANYILLERIELNASAASVTFSNIPQSGYTDLKVVMSARITRSGFPTDIMNVSFNGTSTNESSRRMEGNGSSASSASNSLLLAYQASSTDATANTFGNAEFYIPNYTSSNYKSASNDGVSENNGTTAYAGFAANLWSNTAAITSITFTPDAGSDFVQYSSFSLYGLAAVGTTPVIAPKASGGNIINDGTYWYHTFTSTGAFVPQTGLSCDVLVVAGGGGASRGGGGAGGVAYYATQSLTTTSYTCTIGAGGAGSTDSEGSNAAKGTSGVNSSFTGLTAAVGGGGAGADYSTVNNGLNGGSGGGSGYGRPSSDTRATGTAGQGSSGGLALSDSTTYTSGGGGGGAGAQGGDVNSGSKTGGVGGVGVSTYSSWGTATGIGENVSGTYYFGGGGGGGGNTYAGGAGGYGGGGAGKNTGSSNNGLTNTGGGGGGNADGVTCGQGGSGVVIIRYPIA
jgi:hypothetical protein